MDILWRLEELAKLKGGDPVPRWLMDENGSWAGHMSVTLREAAREIKALRAGLASSCERADIEHIWKCVKGAS